MMQVHASRNTEKTGILTVQCQLSTTTKSLFTNFTKSAISIYCKLPCLFHCDVLHSSNNDGYCLQFYKLCGYVVKLMGHGSRFLCGSVGQYAPTHYPGDPSKN